MNILGLNCIAYDSSSCLIRDGQLIAAFEEERLNRIKYTNTFPKEGIARCLKIAGLTLDEIDYITLNWNPWTGVVPRIWNAVRHSPPSLLGIGVPEGRASAAKWFEILNLSSAFEEHFGISKSKIAPKIRYIHHHLAHAASSYMLSGFHDSSFLTLDGAGEWVTTMLGVGRENQLKVLQALDFPHSVGYLYQSVTEFLGFGSVGGEGKVMGLAAFGQDRFGKEFSKLYELLPNGNFRLNLKYFDFQKPNARFGYSKAMINLLGKPRESHEPLTERHKDIAASLQKSTEILALHLAQHLYEKTKIPRICIAGGVGLNCVMNGRILNELPFDEIFIQPAVSDAGGSVGGAFFLYHHILKNPLSFHLTHSYWGESFSDSEIKKAIEEKGLKYTVLTEPEKETAQLIANNRIIGWFQGRMEFGPRALGNRSILADPRNAEMKERVNKAVKHRELFRPFAPAVLEDKAGMCFEMKVKESPFMLLTFPVRPDWKSRIPAITHADGSARVQTVTKESNERFWKLIREFDQLTGVPMVLNTSFNDRDEPIVASPQDAVRCFLATEIDDLIMGNFRINRNDQRL